jgi:hypothetical protein
VHAVQALHVAAAGVASSMKCSSMPRRTQELLQQPGAVVDLHQLRDQNRTTARTEQLRSDRSA